MKKVLNFLGKFLLWFIACFVLSFVIMVIAIAINGGRPVSGANCSLLSVFIISLLYFFMHRKKRNSEEN